jgi:phosphoglycolate phosphatase
MQEKFNTELVLFDLDGTLVDTAPDFHQSINAILTKYEYPKVDMATLRPYVSEGSSELIKFAFNIDQDDQIFNQLKEEFLKEYKENLTNLSKPFDGISDVINFLNMNNIPYGIVTNKPHEYAEPLINNFDLFNNCKILVCPDHVKISKPNPEGIILACNKLSVLPEKTIYLGDHNNDLKAGESAGTKVIGCGYGYSLNTKSTEMMANSPKEIIRFID